MSRALDLADKMAVYLETLPQLSGIDVIVDRQKDIDNEILKACEKASGAAVVILYVGGRNKDATRMSSIRKTCKYAVTVNTVPVIREEINTPSDDLVEAIESALQGWKPVGFRHCSEGARVLGDELVPDPVFLRMDIQVEMDLTL